MSPESSGRPPGFSKATGLLQRIRGIGQTSGGDEGAVAIIVALLPLIIVGMVAFAVDIGYSASVKRQLSVTADGSVLAGAAAAAEEFSKQRRASTYNSCTDLKVADLDDAASSAAEDIYAKNNALGSAAPDDVYVVVECGDETVGRQPGIYVVVKGKSSLSPLFGWIWGVDKMTPEAVAVAKISGSPTYSGLRPFAICDQTVRAARGGGIVISTFELNPPGASGGSEAEDAPCPTPSGNWGLVDLNGDDPDGSSKDLPSLDDWTRNGYDGAVSIPDETMPGSPGNKAHSNGIRDALESILGQEILLPVADAWTVSDPKDPGANATFDAIGVVKATLCGFRVNPGGSGTNSGYWPPKQTEDPRCPWPTVTSRLEEPPESDLQLWWHYEDSSTSYQSSPKGPSEPEECNLDNEYCLAAIRLWQ